MAKRKKKAPKKRKAQSKFADQLAERTIAVRFSRSKFVAKRALNSAQQRKTADTFNAAHGAVRAEKKLIDTKHEAYKRVTSVLSQAYFYWVSMTTPFPDRGVRLMRRDQIEAFEERMNALRSELDAAVAELEDRYVALRAEAAARLGDVFNAADYPDTLTGEFAIDWDYPEIGASTYLAQLHPALYEQECGRVRERFEDAVALAEQAFTEELAKLVNGLSKSLRGVVDGKQRYLKTTSINRLRSFFDRFKSLSVSSNPDLDALVEEAKAVLDNNSVTDLREDKTTQRDVADALASIGTSIATMEGEIKSMMVQRKRRISFDD